ncbi:hypothetical protein RintRC_1855 [Richelia intracellularis]|nr:hypothetical protein RintRC_1855 [Richelia intracellularis]
MLNFSRCPLHINFFPLLPFSALLNQGMISLNFQRFLNGFKR